MPDILQVTVPTGSAAPVWSARASNVNSLLFINQDLDNTIWIGQQSNITAAGPNTIPIVPNGTFTGDASSAWYVTGSVAGTQPLVVVPNGQGYFLGLTQGQGKLVLPQVQSPNFSLSGQTGWAILKNGNAYFFNITATGNITATAFIGTDFEINENGAYWYNGTPAPGNPPVLSIVRPGVTTDPFGNTVYTGFVSYGSGGIITQLTNGILNMGLPPTATTEPATIDSPDGYSIVVSAGLKSAVDVAAALSLQSAAVAGAGYPDGAIFTTAPIIFGTWQNATMGTDWTGPLQYRLLPDGNIQFFGTVEPATGATFANGTVMASTAAAFQPTSSHYLVDQNGSGRFLKFPGGSDHVECFGFTAVGQSCVVEGIIGTN